VKDMREREGLAVRKVLGVVEDATVMAVSL
jgi:hypothetical protein